jgi:hypothetical protein
LAALNFFFAGTKIASLKKLYAVLPVKLMDEAFKNESLSSYASAHGYCVMFSEGEEEGCFGEKEKNLVFKGHFPQKKKRRRGRKKNSTCITVWLKSNQLLLQVPLLPLTSCLLRTACSLKSKAKFIKSCTSFLLQQFEAPNSTRSCCQLICNLIKFELNR